MRTRCDEDERQKLYRVSRGMGRILYSAVVTGPGGAQDARCTVSLVV
jgi:hypothetical protein